MERKQPVFWKQKWINIIIIMDFEDDWTDDELEDFMLQQEIKKREPICKTEPEIGRNDPCPCGSGKKYKKCCGRNL